MHWVSYTVSSSKSVLGAGSERFRCANVPSSRRPRPVSPSLKYSVIVHWPHIGSIGASATHHELESFHAVYVALKYLRTV